jgi:hypothetical protein
MESEPPATDRYVRVQVSLWSPKENMTKHTIISLIKSIIRISGAGVCIVSISDIVNAIIILCVSLIIAEIIGIFEELI